VCDLLNNNAESVPLVSGYSVNRYSQKFGEDFLHLLWKGIDSPTPELYLKNAFKVFVGRVLTVKALRSIEV